MAFSVNLYNFSKKENSTAQPAGSPASYSCILKHGSGLVAPSISLDLGRSTSPASYNYAYIPEFKRYYWINEWTYEDALWTAQMVCDVLASFKAAIGASTLYVLRAASAYDGNIVDNLYPTKAIPTHSVTTFNTAWHTAVDGNLMYGGYVLGIVDDVPSHGSMSYYALPYNSLVLLMDFLMNNFVTQANGFDLADASIMLQKNLVDPFDYIRSCIWVPYGLTSIGDGNYTNTNIYIGGINTGITASKLKYTYNCTVHESITISGFARHPQAASRGAYMNIAPYTEAEIFIPPFGLIPLDTRVLASSTNIVLDIRCDLIKGTGIMNVEMAGTDCSRTEAQLGVPIQLSQIRQDIIGGMTSLIGASASAAMGDVIGSAAGIGSAVQAAMPKASTIGGAGGWSDLSGQPGLVQHFYSAVDDDIAHAGRPLMQSKQISSLSGYIIVQDGDVSIDGTASEAAQIRSYLEAGFFYE